MVWIVKKLFDDKRYTVGLLLVWMVTVCTIFYFLGAFHMNYMHVGPSSETVFMGLKIDNWTKWSSLAVFSFFNTCINEFISNSLAPWFLNSLQDHKTKSIEYSHATCLWIVQIHCMYVHVMGIFSLFLFFSQVDFAFIRLLADWIVTGFSTVWFIQDKKVVRSRNGRHLRLDSSADEAQEADDILSDEMDELNESRAQEPRTTSRIHHRRGASMDASHSGKKGVYLYPPFPGKALLSEVGADAGGSAASVSPKFSIEDDSNETQTLDESCLPVQ